MLSRLDLMTIQPKVVLDIGCGTGEMAGKLFERYPQAKVLAFDNTYSMVQYAKDKSSSIYVCAEGEKLPLPSHSVDFIFANFFLPWQQDVKTILNEWLRILVPNGLLMLTALGLNTLQEWREVLSSQHTPKLVDMHDIGDALLQAGFADPVLDVDYYQATYRNQTHLLQELRASGFWFPERNEQISENFKIQSIEGVWPLTYEIIFAHAFAPLESQQAEKNGEVKIPLAHLRRQLRV